MFEAVGGTVRIGLSEPGWGRFWPRIEAQGRRIVIGEAGRGYAIVVKNRTGDRIEVETALGHHVYEVRDSFVVEPTDVWVADDRSGGWLTLTTCNPKFDNYQRLIVHAVLDG